MAHGLPTKYSHFLEFCQRVKRIFDYDKEQSMERFEELSINNWQTNETIKNSILTVFSKRKTNDHNGEKTIENLELLEIYNLLDDNVWYLYLNDMFKKNCIKGENWIDFESEIRLIIKNIDENTSLLTESWENIILSIISKQREV